MITIVSLAYNKLEMTKEFLERLVKYTDIPFQLVFTDNGSTEPISALVREKVPSATILRYPKNIGCPATRNPSMKCVETQFTFWLDNDCMVGPKWYEPVMDKLKDETIGISGPFAWVVNNPWIHPFPFRKVESGDCDWFMGYLVGFRTKAYKPINDYKVPVNMDDVELAWGVKSNGYRAVVSEPCFANHLTSQTDRGWEFDDQKKLEELWKNWPDKSIFERFK